MAVAGWTRPDMLMRYTKAQASARAAEEARKLNLGSRSSGNRWRPRGVALAGYAADDATTDLSLPRRSAQGVAMNKAELVDSIIERTGWSRRRVGGGRQGVRRDRDGRGRCGDKVTLPGFGTFEKRGRAARTARNPQTGEPIKVKKTSVPAFRPGTGFKAYVAMSKKDQTAHRKRRD